MPEACDHGPALSGLLDGELSEAERERLTSHLRDCADCAAEHADLRRVRSQLRSLPSRKVPEGLLAAAERAAEGSRVRDRHRRAERTAVAGLLVAAVTAGALAWGGPDDPVRTVEVPVETFVSDHIVRTGAGPLLTPVLTGE